MEPVYSPAEDSWLLEDYLLKENLVNKRCLDFGCGSGIQAIAMLKAGASEVLSVDVNESALEETEKKVKKFIKLQEKQATQNVGPSKTQGGFTGQNKQSLFDQQSNALSGPAKPKALLGHFLGAKKSEYFSSIEGKFDFIAFNPPYVPTDGIKWRDLDGGEKGRVVIDKFISEVKKHLTPQGAVLLLVSSLNEINEIVGELKKNGFAVKVASSKKLFFEELVLLRAELA